MNASTVRQWCERASLQNFAGVYSPDRLGELAGKAGHYNFICNTANSWQRGTHFICVGVGEREICVYDSLAAPKLLFSEFYDALARHYGGRRLRAAIRRPVQHWATTDCGYFAIFCAILCDGGVKKFPYGDFDMLNLENNGEIAVGKITNYLLFTGKQRTLLISNK